jgi:hypothetical protein
MNTKAQQYLDKLYISDMKKMIDFLQSRDKFRNEFRKDLSNKPKFRRDPSLSSLK